MSELLLDTCAVIWLAAGEPIARPAAVEIEAASVPLQVSAMSAWEIGLLASRNRIALSMPPEVWFRRIVESDGVALRLMDVEALIASSFLPGSPPRDPVDRILIATARGAGLRIVTRDREILRYAGEGHVAAVPC